LQRLLDRRQVREDERELPVRSPVGATPKEDIEGLRSPVSASSAPKSVSAETRIRSSSPARKKTSSSSAACKP